MRTVGKLMGGVGLVAAGVLGSAAGGAAAGPSVEVLCERIGGGEVPTNMVFSNWGCEMTHASEAGKQRLMRVADKSKLCARDDLIEFTFDFGPFAGGARTFIACIAR